MAQLTFNMSLARTSVTSNTILSSTSALFTFLFAVALLSEAFSMWKLVFILLLIAVVWLCSAVPFCAVQGRQRALHA
jgi:drug/metabolite transporter (DMT)-like permease